MLNECTKQSPGHQEFFFWVFVEETIFVEKIVDHATKDLLFPHDCRGFELLQHLDHVRDVHFAGVNLTKEGWVG